MNSSEKNRRRLVQVKDYVREHWQDCEVYAYGGSFEGPHYKTLWFTPHGVWKSDTATESVITQRDAKVIIANHKNKEWPLVQTDPARVISNWKETLIDQAVLSAAIQTKGGNSNG